LRIQGAADLGNQSHLRRDDCAYELTTGRCQGKSVVGFYTKIQSTLQCIGLLGLPGGQHRAKAAVIIWRTVHLKQIMSFMPAAAIMGRIYSEPGEKSQVAVEQIRQVLTGASQVDQPCSSRVPSGKGALGNFGVFAFSSKLAEAHFAAIGCCLRLQGQKLVKINTREDKH
jgi:hypothetical protein